MADSKEFTNEILRVKGLTVATQSKAALCYQSKDKNNKWNKLIGKVKGKMESFERR